MAWYEQPYKKGKLLPVPGFPRPLYPPDAAPGHEPSTPGPDVEAYKRTVSRAGRWPWQDFDESYSNAFSHGTDSNVGDSGVAGVQRQQGYKATGFIGLQTFNLFRAMLVPEGKQHAGEHAMDVTAQNLIAEAWTLYGGQPTLPPTPSLSTRQRALQGAKKWIGTKEVPADSNHTPFGVWYGVDRQPWCAIFVTFCYVIEAGGSPSFQRGSHYAYCPYIVSDARNKRNGLSVTTNPVPGDLVLYDWGRDGTFDHVGLFDSWQDASYNSFNAVEGNTGPSNFSNGGMVMRTVRMVRGQSTVFVHVAE